MLTVSVQHPPSLVLPVALSVTTGLPVVIGAGNLVSLDAEGNANLGDAAGTTLFGICTNDFDNDDPAKPARVEVHVKPPGAWLGLAMRLKLSGAITLGAAVYPAANGQVSGTANGAAIGYAMEAGADQELVICSV